MASPAEKVHVCVLPGANVWPSGPLVTLRVGGVLSMVKPDSLKFELPAASIAVARSVAGPSATDAVSNATENGAELSDPTSTPRTRKSTRCTVPELSVALAARLIVPRWTPELGAGAATLGAWASRKRAVIVVLVSTVSPQTRPVTESHPSQPS